MLRLSTIDAGMNDDGYGYNPLVYFFASVGAGWFMVFRGFSMLNFPSIPLELACIVLVMGLVAMVVPLFPDYLDRLVSFDMRSRAGPRFVGLLAVALLIGTTIVWITVQSKVFGIW